MHKEFLWLGSKMGDKVLDSSVTKLCKWLINTLKTYWASLAFKKIQVKELWNSSSYPQGSLWSKKQGFVWMRMSRHWDPQNFFRECKVIKHHLTKLQNFLKTSSTESSYKPVIPLHGIPKINGNKCVMWCFAFFGFLRSLPPSSQVKHLEAYYYL